MTRRSLFLPAAIALTATALLAWAPASRADQPSRIVFLPESKLWLEGNSTLHPYQSRAQQWQIASPTTPGAPWVITIPVRGLKSGEGALDDNMYRTLNADQFPTIRFVSKTCRLRITGAAVEAVAEGRLALAGAERTVSVVATGTMAGETVRLSGEKELKMTDFGVNPPVLLGGMIRCSDRIVVHYDLVGRVSEL